jgi:hypothetical protein
MSLIGHAVILAGLLLVSQFELDCAHVAAARTLIGQARLSEIEWAEDVSREAMWDAFGRCPSGPGAQPCREELRQRFEAELDAQKAAIREKYDGILRDFVERCLASIARAEPTRADFPRTGLLQTFGSRP